MSQIVLDKVTKYYGTEAALENVTLYIEDDLTTAVVGPSGSGKSTLLQLINALVRPDTGEIRVFDRPVDYTRLPHLRRKIGYAVQGTGLFPHMTVWQNITLLARLGGWDGERIRSRAEGLMDLVGLPHEFAARYPHELSGGEQQRVGLCRAMMINPPVFLLDEPFGALDPMTRSEIHAEFVKLQRSESRTVVLVTHDVREALKLAQRVVVLGEGQVVQNGTCREVVEEPANAFVRELFRSQIGEWRPE